MQKKRKYKLLLTMLVLSGVVLCCLIFVLNYKDTKLDVLENNNSSVQEEYYLPSVTAKELVVSHGTKVLPEMFISSVESIYEVVFSYEKEPNLEKYGIQNVIVLVTDEIGNSVAIKTKLNILNIKEKLELNLGEVLPIAEDFLVEAGSKISYLTDVSHIDTSIVKEYEIDFLVDGEYAHSILSIGDYEAPKVVTKDVQAWLHQPVKIEEFIVSMEDRGTVTYQYETEPDWSRLGKQQVKLLVSDENDNVTLCEVVLTIVEDTKAPVVSVSNLDVTVGDVISYKKAISYYDNASSVEEMIVEIDNSKVNLDKVGVYDVIYTVMDVAKNATTVVSKVNVIEEVPVWNDEEALKTKGLEVLEEILNKRMSDYEKAEAIFRWVNTKIRFINFSEKDNFMRGAYEGLFLQKGDCFVYAATSKFLLTLAQIPNIDIKKVTTNPSHYWNLVYIEDGWYHFDANPTKEGTKVFLYTEEQLETFSSSRGNTHVYDKSLYPEIK